MDAENEVRNYLDSLGVKFQPNYIKANTDKEKVMHAWRNSSDEWDHALLVQWAPSFTRNSRTETFTYRQGLGHLDIIPQGLGTYNRIVMRDIDYFEAAAKTLNTGKVYKVAEGSSVYHVRSTSKHLTLDSASVLYCLLMDSMAHDDPFDEWAENLGYNPDSMKAKRIYDECVGIHFKVRNIFNPEESEHLRGLLENY